MKAFSRVCDILHRCLYNVHLCFTSLAAVHSLVSYFDLMETPISDQREEEQIDVEADLEEMDNDETEDEELKFDPDQDLWVSVRVERRAVRDSSVSDSSYWVWEVEKTSHISPLNTLLHLRWAKLMMRVALCQQGDQ